MHEFMLFGQIPNSRHDQVLNILSGVTASQPSPFTHQHLIYAPLKAEAVGTATKKRSQQQVNQQSYYHDLYRTISTDPQSAWKLRINQEPEPGLQHFLSRGCTAPAVLDISKYDDSTMFRFVTQQIHSGHYFVHGNLVIQLFRVLLSSVPSENSSPFQLPSMKDFSLLDASGSYVVEASARLEDRSNSKLSDSATKELLNMKKMLQGAIELYAPDRLSLDTRVKAI